MDANLNRRGFCAALLGAVSAAALVPGAPPSAPLYLDELNFRYGIFDRPIPKPGYTFIELSRVGAA